MKTQQAWFIFTFFVVLHNASLLASDVVQRKLTNNANVLLTADAWQHITEGHATEQDFKGGHDYGFFERNHVRNNPDASVFFDTKMHAYIVSSQKGEELPRIIANLQNRQTASYHTLFPPDFLTKEFVLEAFEKAYKNPDKENNIDHDKKLFYARMGNMAVAGLFFKRTLKKGNKKINNFHIATIFPDLSWEYRIDFKHNPEKTFSISRFLQWDHTSKQWLSQGLTAEQVPQFQNNQYLPKPILYMLNPANTQCGQLDGDKFALMSSLRSEILREHCNKEINIIDLFFKDISKPTDEEYQLLIDTLKKIMPNTSIPSAKKGTPLLRKINLLKRHLNTIINNQAQTIIVTDNNGEGAFAKSESVGKFNLHLGEEILYHLLDLDSQRAYMKEIFSQLFTEEDYAIRAQAAKKVARNLMAKLVPEKETRLHLKSKNIGFNMRILNEVDYALELIVQTDLQQTQNEEDRYNQSGIALVKGESVSQLYVRLRPITSKVVTKSVERLRRLQKMQQQ